MTRYPVPHEPDCDCSRCRMADRQLDRSLAAWRADIERKRVAKATRRDRGWRSPAPGVRGHPRNGYGHYRGSGGRMTQPTGHLLLGYTVCPFISAELERSMAARDFMDARAFICGRPGAYEVIDSEGAHCVVCGEHAAWLRSDPHLTRLPYSIASVTA